MNLSPMPDMGWSYILVVLGLYTSLLTAPLTILVEAWIIWILLTRDKNTFTTKVTFDRALRYSTIINLVSGVLGILSVYLIVPVAKFVSSYSYIYTGANKEAVLWAADLVLSFGLGSFLIEGILLWMMESDRSPLRIWLVSLLGNLVTNLGLFAILLIYIISR